MIEDQDGIPLTDAEVAMLTFERTLDNLQREGYSPCSILIGLARCSARAADRLARVLYDDDDDEEDS
jgi:hypothetical protein